MGTSLLDKTPINPGKYRKSSCAHATLNLKLTYKKKMDIKTRSIDLFSKCDLVFQAAAAAAEN